MPRNANGLEPRLRRVEQELAALKAALAALSEQELAVLKADLALRPGKRWYREIVGSFAGDKTLAEIVRLGRLIRQGKLKR